jgi:type VI secretion system protein ImpL
MIRFLRLFLDARVLGVLGLIALAAFLFLGAEALQIGLIYAGLALAVVAAAVLGAWGARRLRARRAAARLERDLQGNLQEAGRAAPARDKARTAAVQARLQEAIRTIKTSKLGERSGRAALYELPWYMVIGNPAAGKSTAIVQSGLRFPFARGTDSIIQGIGGTRNCDWFFTSEGILLDTAGRYAVQEEDRAEWLGFLALLKKNRPKAPINGILIAASIAELNETRPDAVIRLAKSLRQRVQELTEALEVFAPVYLVFTKADLIAGFVEFFADQDAREREKAWGAALPYRPGQAVDAVEQFDRHFDELQDGLKELALATMTLHRGKPVSPAVLAFPLEFAGLKPVLRAFVATLFEDNPYQWRPVFRGFYFTSAVQAGESSSRTRNEVAAQFALAARPAPAAGAAGGENGFFLKDLFARVVFADRDLVRRHASRAKVRARTFGFAAGVVALAVLLAGWSWSYAGNRQLVAGVRADLAKAAQIQENRVDLASRMEALELLQDRLEEMIAWRRQRPLSVGLGLYQGDAVERKLRQEYFQGVRRVMLEPVAQALEGYLGEVNQHAAELRPLIAAGGAGGVVAGAAAPPAAAGLPRPAAAPPVPSRYAEASATNVEDAYKALKTYLMLADRSRMDAGHLTDQVTRFWRGWLETNRGAMPREQMMRSAERMISFSMAHLQDPAFPVVDSNFGLVDQTRDNLRRVVQGTPAIERAYAEIKARASTRYGAVTVSRIVGDKGRTVAAGSHAVPGTFTREAWTGYIDQAFRNAADHELQSSDWVLKTSNRDDLSLQGSPEQVRKALTELYKAEYAREWQRFVQGVSIADFGGFEAAVEKMNILGDSAESPVRKLFVALHEQTSWDAPGPLDERLAGTGRDVAQWFRQSVLRMAPAPVEIRVALPSGAADAAPPMGAVGREFAALPRIMVARDGGASLLDGYLQGLARIRSRFNQMKNQGDVGPAARALMAATFEGTGSELAEALKFVDEQMLTGASDTARSTLKPLLVRPLIQSFAVLVAPAEAELNRLWAAQALQPFQQSLAGKYPFDAASRIEASPAEIGRVFGPAGAIARFSTEALGPLVTRRGDSVAPRLWAGLGLRLRPAFAEGLPNWVAVLDGAAGAAPAAGAASAAPSAAGGPAQANFQLLPEGSVGFVQYTVEIDGQQLTYRNGAAGWHDFSWPNPTRAPGARISGVTADGRTVEVFSAPGGYGFERLIDAADVQRLPGGVRTLRWGAGDQAVSVQYRAVTSPGPAVAPPPAGAGGAPAGARGLRGLRLPELVAGADAPAPSTGAAAGAASGVAR